MSLLEPRDTTPIEISPSQREKFESEIFFKLKEKYSFKDLACYFAILKLTKSTVFLGGTSETVGKIDYDYLLRCALEETAVSVLKGYDVKIELKSAQDEALAVKARLEAKQAQAKRDAASKEKVDEQVKAGKCDLIPFPLKENKVRSELTIERHAIFAANTFKGDFRTYEKTIKDLKTGETVKIAVKVGDRTGQVKGVLKQKHQEAFYKLAQIWSQQEYRLQKDELTTHGAIKLSVYELVRTLRGEDGGKAYKSVFQLLREMATIWVEIKICNQDTKRSDVNGFSLLSFEWEAKNFNEDSERPELEGDSRVRIRFSDYITENFLKKNVKPLLLDPYFSLKDKGRKGVAQLLYSMLDYELSTKQMFNISLSKLAERIGLTPYRFKSKRKEQFQTAIKMLNGREILDGKYMMNVYILDSETKKDWVLVARRAES